MAILICRGRFLRHGAIYLERTANSRGAEQLPLVGVLLAHALHTAHGRNRVRERHDEGVGMGQRVDAHQSAVSLVDHRTKVVREDVDGGLQRHPLAGQRSIRWSTAGHHLPACWVVV